MVISFVLNKGGTGKTTSAVNIGAALARCRGRRVLLVDLDGQASASWALGLNDHLEPSTADIISWSAPIRRVMRHTGVPNLDIAPASYKLSTADLHIRDSIGREFRLRNSLATVRREYDFILVDCPPTVTLVFINALVASDAYIVPVAPEFLALRGLVGLDRAIENLKQSVGLQAEMLGILLTRVDYRVRTTSEIIESIRDLYQEDVFQTEIRVNIRLSEAPAAGQDIFRFDPTSTGAQAYLNLADEIIDRCQPVKSPPTGPGREADPPGTIPETLASKTSL